MCLSRQINHLAVVVTQDDFPQHQLLEPRHRRRCQRATVIHRYFLPVRQPFFAHHQHRLISRIFLFPSPPRIPARGNTDYRLFAGFAVTPSAYRPQLALQWIELRRQNISLIGIRQRCVSRRVYHQMQLAPHSPLCFLTSS